MPVNGLLGQMTHKDISGRMIFKNEEKANFKNGPQCNLGLLGILKEDKSENISDKTLTYFFVLSLLISLLLCIVFELFPSLVICHQSFILFG